MQRVANIPYLFRRGTVYYFRRRVPERALDAFGGKECHQVSLETGSLAEAKARLARVNYSFECVVASASPQKSSWAHGEERRPAGFSRDEARRVVQRWFVEREGDLDTEIPNPGDLGWEEDSQFPPQKVILDFLKGRADQAQKALETGPYELQDMHIAQALLERMGEPALAKEHRSTEFQFVVRQVTSARLELARRGIAQLRGEGRQEFNTGDFGAEAIQQSASDKGLSLAECRKRFLESKARAVRAGTLTDYERKLRMFEEVLGPRTPVSQVNRDQLRDFKENVLMILPKNFRQAYPGATPRQAAELGSDDGRQVVSPKTVNTHLDLIASFFEFCEIEEYVEKNPAKRLRVPIAEDDEQEVESFSSDQLSLIFGAPLFAGCVNDARGYAKPGSKKPRRHRFWMPLIGLYSGMRLREICQLKAGDVLEDDGVWVLDIKERVKTRSSVRKVPVHKVLIDLGLLEYKEKLKPSDWLFPDLPRGVAENPGYPFSKWFGRFLDSVGLSDPGYRFHSFRHTWRTALRNAMVPPEVVTRMGGWADFGVQAGYGRDATSVVLKAEIDKVDFEGLDLSHLVQHQD